MPTAAAKAAFGESGAMPTVAAKASLGERGRTPTTAAKAVPKGKSILSKGKSIGMRGGPPTRLSFIG
eukprot:scaffold21539_cov19-Phaeocystis_antarctica.AAC.1